MLVVPAIDLIDGKCVRLYQGDYENQTIYNEDPVGQALKFQSVRFPRLHLVDLQGARSGSGQNRQAIKRILKAVAIPVQIGGGIRTFEDVKELLDGGARYLILGTVALKEPSRVSEWIERWGPENFIISLDLRQGMLQSEGWIEQSPVTLDQMMERISQWGIGQVICTDVEKDGTMEQPNYETYKTLLCRLPGRVTLLAAGGICSVPHIMKLKEIGVGGAVVGRALYENQIPMEELASAG